MHGTDSGIMAGLGWAEQTRGLSRPIGQRIEGRTDPGIQ